MQIIVVQMEQLIIVSAKVQFLRDCLSFQRKALHWIVCILLSFGTQVRDVLRNILNMRRDIQFLRVLRYAIFFIILSSNCLDCTMALTAAAPGPS